MHKEQLARGLAQKEKEFDCRRHRYNYLVHRFETFQKRNPEQAEAYLIRARLHQKKLEEAIAEILLLREKLRNG